MISEIKIRDFKSIREATLRPRRVTVLIGENGSGKSNVLEAIAFVACATTDKLDDEILFHRGVRVTDHTWMVSAFPEMEASAKKRNIGFSVKSEKGEALDLVIVPQMREDDKSFSKWRVSSRLKSPESIKTLIENFNPKFAELAKQMQIQFELKETSEPNEEVKKQFQEELSKRLQPLLEELQAQVERHVKAPLSELSTKFGLADFLIYGPESSTLRSQPPEGAIQPLGTKGEGLFRLLQSFTDDKFKEYLADLQSRLHLFGWFDKFVCSDDTVTKQANLKIQDRWLARDKSTFDQRSANEGFLFVLFYFALIISWRTPKFFAIDNIDTALNPKLCSTLMTQIVELAKRHDKQVICTTHNPAILDGLDLKDDEQRLYTVRRDSEGHTVLRRVRAPEPQRAGELPVRLSEAFLRGIIGGLPDHF